MMLLYFILFIISVFIAFFIPGDVLLKKIPLSLFQRAVLGTVVGMVLWAWQGFIFGYLGLRWLSFAYLALFFAIWLLILLKKHSAVSFRLKFPKLDWLLLIVIIFGVIIQLSSVWFNGIYSKKGLYFCCGNLYDSILHIALTDQVVKRFPPIEPGMSGTEVTNYHYWGNLAVADLIRVFKLPLISTQYQYSTVFLSLFLGLTAMAFGQILNLGRNFIRWLAFFLYFGGDTIYLIVSFIRREINFQMSSLEDGAKFLVNPPRAFSIIIFFTGVSLLFLWLKKKNFKAGLLASLIIGTLAGFKIYTGIFALSGLGFLGLKFLAKRDLKSISILILAFIISIIVYLPTNKNAGGLYFTGFYIFENFIVQPWMMLDRLELARLIYLEHNSWIRVIQYEAIYIFLFFLAIFGTKLIGLFQTKRSLSLLTKELNIFFLGGIIISAALGFFFQQKSGGANTFNFLVSIFIIGSVYSALACSYWQGKIKLKFLKLLFILVIVALTIPRVINELYLNINKIKNEKGYTILNPELDALGYLKTKTEPNSLILVDYNYFTLDKESPYVSFLSKRPMFLSGLGDELSAHGIDFSDRKAESDIILNFDSSGSLLANTLLKNKIDYLYLSSIGSRVATDSVYFLEPVFENQKVTILKVSKESIYNYLRNNKKQ